MNGKLRDALWALAYVCAAVVVGVLIAGCAGPVLEAELSANIRQDTKLYGWPRRAIDPKTLQPEAGA